MSPLLHEPRLLPLVCSTCALPLTLSPAAAAYPCTGCGRVYEPQAGELREVPVGYVQATSEVERRGELHLLPFWEFPAEVAVERKRAANPAAPDYTWGQVRRRAARKGTAPRSPSLFVPAFALERVVVARLGVRLLRAQPEMAVLAQGEQGLGGRLPPLLLDEADARVAAHFVYLALEADATPELRSIDYDLRLGPGRVLFLPADYDRRLVHDANWRLLLREFDGLLA